MTTNKNKEKRHVTNEALAFIINKPSRKNWRYHMQDIVISVITWGCWLFLIMQPFFRVWLNPEGDHTMIHTLTLENGLVLLLAAFIVIMMIVHFWVRYHMLLWRWRTRQAKRHHQVTQQEQRAEDKDFLDDHHDSARSIQRASSQHKASVTEDHSE
ncbi:hypothetical protein L4D76_26505 [Photobacterium sagamiensis]|uniref:hypothetical protein n=1 Tax=Photobacterium sagamiensis TaxID=2910241 RepID=UPI003D0A6B7A